MSTSRPRLDEDQRKVLEYLKAAADDGEGALVNVFAIQSDTFWPIAPVLESLQRRKLIVHSGEHRRDRRYYKITDAGREALSP
jgi:DNA-binding PadR family transcriptional regulator